jgi:multiple sugar transport system substrate-binding protein
MASRVQKSITALSLAAVAATGTAAAASASQALPATNSATGAVLTAANSINGCDPSKVTLQVAFTQTGAAGETAASAAMKAKYPGLKVEGTASTITSYDQLSQIIVANKAAGVDDNVIQVGLDQVHFWVNNYHPAPLNTADLSPTYNKQYLSLGAIKGKDYVAPFQVDFPALFVNTTLTAKAGLGPNELPKTSSQLIADATTVKKATGTAPVYYSPDAIPDWYSQALIQSGGSTFVNANGTAGFNTAKADKALSVYTDLGKDGLETPAPEAQALAAFEEGTLPYLLTPTSLTDAIYAAVGSKFQWSDTTMPVPDGGKASYPTGGNGWMVLSSDQCTVAYASQFIADMLSPATITLSSKTYPYLPVDSSSLSDVLSADKGKPQLTFAESYKGKLTPWSGFPGSVTNQADTILQTMVETLIRGAAPATAVPTAVSQINALVTKGGNS